MVVVQVGWLEECVTRESLGSQASEVSWPRLVCNACSGVRHAKENLRIGLPENSEAAMDICCCMDW